MIQTPRRRSGGSGRSGSASMSSSSAAVRDPSDPSAKHFSQPTRARPSGPPPSGSPLRRPCVDRRRRARRRATTTCDPDRQPAGLGEVACRPGTTSPGRGSGDEAARIVDGHDAEGDAARCADAARGRVSSSVDGHRPAPCVGDEAGGRLEQDALRRRRRHRGGSRRRRDRASSRRRRPSRSAARLARSAWWSCAQSAHRRPGATGSRSAAVGQRPQRSESQPWPSSQASGSTRRSCAARISASPSSSVRASVRSTWRSATAAVGEVEVRVGQARDRDLVGLEGDPFGERVGPRLEVDLGAGERHAAVADPDRLHPAEPGVARQRGDPTRDQGVERHRLSLRVGQQRRQPVAVQPGADARAPGRPVP